MTRHGGGIVAAQNKNRWLWIGALTAGIFLAGPAQARKVCMSARDLVAVKLPLDPRISPDGKWVLFGLKVSDAKANRNRVALYVVPTTGGKARRLTRSKGSDFSGRWSPKGDKILFISTRNGSPQLFVLPFAQGGEARQVTHIETGVTGPVWSPDGKWALAVSDLFRGCKTLDCSIKRHKAKKASLVKALVTDHLLYRHWDTWRNNKVSQVLRIDLPNGKPHILTPENRDVPPLALGSSHDYVVSPDGREVAFVMNTDRIVAASTNNDVFLVKSTGGRPRRITTSHANQNGPAYSPDGRYLAYLAMVRPGYESDRQRIVVVDRKTGRKRTLLGRFDRSVAEFVWSPDGKTIYFTADDRGYVPVFSVPLAGGPVKTLISKVHARGLTISRDGRFLVFRSEAANRPQELYRFDLVGRRLTQLTHFNNWLRDTRAFGKLESFWFKGARGDRVQAFLLWPAPQCRKPGRIPVVHMIHGGPQGMLGDDFHPRWNAALFAAPGYAVLMVNFHGSTGYGQAFTDSIRGDWGGKPYRDIMLGLQAALRRHRNLDPRRVCAAGASYGGYMIDWIGGHTKRFKCLITHDGVYNLESMYGATEELWFPEWEYHGLPWGRSKQSQYRRWSPHNYVQNWKTPTLIVHGQHDFRVPVTQGMQLFTALKRLGVTARFLYFPDETHFVQKPLNRLLWWNQVHGWFARFLK